MNSYWLKSFPARACNRSMLPYLAAGAGLAVAIFVVGRDIEQHISAIEAWITNLGPWSVFAFIGLFVLGTSVLLPETLLVVAAGALYGVERGMAVVLVGSLVASALQFLLSRYLLRNRIQRTLQSRPMLSAIQQAVTRGGYRLQVLLRLTPLNPAAMSYLLGAAGVRFPTFILACFTLIPYFFIEVSFGHAGLHAAHMSGSPSRAMYLHDLLAIGSLTVGVIMVVLVSRRAHKTLIGVMAKTGNTEQSVQTRPLRGI